MSNAGILIILLSLHAQYAHMNCLNGSNHLYVSQEICQNFCETMKQSTLHDTNCIFDEYAGNMYVVDHANK